MYYLIYDTLYIYITYNGLHMIEYTIQQKLKHIMDNIQCITNKIRIYIIHIYSLYITNSL